MAYLTAAQLRAAYPNATGLTEDKVGDAVLEDYIAEFAEIAEEYRGVAYEERHCTETILTRRAQDTIALKWSHIRTVTSVTVDDTLLDSSSYEVDKLVGAIILTTTVPNVEVVVVYTHGLGSRQVTDGATTSTDKTVTSATGAFDTNDIGAAITGTGIPTGATIVSINSTTSVEISDNATATATGLTLTIGAPPATLLRACREYVRSCALADRSNVPRDVIGQTFDGGYTRYSTPDKDAGRPTGYLDVDRLLNSLDDFRFGFA